MSQKTFIVNMNMHCKKGIYNCTRLSNMLETYAEKRYLK